jgi:subtilisin family serine protease
MGKGQFGTPRRILSDDIGAVHALPVAVGQECAALEMLRRHPDVAFTELDYAVHAVETDSVMPNDPDWANQWGPAKIEAPTAWDVTTGTSDAIIAIVDTGVELGHEDLVDNLWANPGEIPDNGLDDDGNGKTDDIWGWRFYHVSPLISGEDNSVADDNGHGTHVAGIAGAGINNGLGVAGMAGGSKLMVVKVLDAVGDGWYSDLAQGIVYAVDNGARIINLSLGGAPHSDLLQWAVNYAHDRGALLVAASGNGVGGVLYPGACEHVMTVSATDQDDDLRSDSRHGPQVDVAAPGTAIYSTGWSGSCPSGYCYMSGTSMATPHASGLAALIWSARPDLASLQVTSAITATAVDVNGHVEPGWDEYVGWGRIDAGEAISEALSLPVNEYGVEVTPPRAAMTGTVGSLTTYALTVWNLGNASDAYLAELDGNAWDSVLSADLIGPVAPDAFETVEITVSIPISAGVGSTDTGDVILTSVGDRSQSAISTLTTTATGKTYYLPLIRLGR